jgi:2'-5' RNA ligase
MRTFIAIDLNNENKALLAKLQAELKHAQADIKWVDPDNIHLTLKFLGEVTEEYIGKVKESLDKATAGSKPFELSLSGIGAFPNLNYARVIWVGVEKGKKETEEIAKKIEEALCGLGFPKEGRPFAAHLTIGRVRSGKNKEALRDKITDCPCLAGRQGLLIADCQKVSSITLYQSQLTPQGPFYTPLHKVTL